MSLTNLANMESEAFKSFLDSFDTVLCDCDGVIWHTGILIPGANESLTILKKLGKNVRFVTNNTVVGLSKLRDGLQAHNIEAELCDIANPCLAIVNYFKKIEFNGKVFVLGSSHFQEDLRNAGVIISDLKIPDSIDDNIQDTINYLKETLKNASDIGAVIFDTDLNLNYLKLNFALALLHNQDVLFISACADKVLPVTPTLHAIGPEYFIKPVKDLTGREPIECGKPSAKLQDLIIEKFKIDNPSRALFIGDSLDTDIEFASKMGCQTLLVLTGSTKLETVKNCACEDRVPNFYIQSLGDLPGLINKI